MSIQAAQAERTQAAVEQARAGERNLGPAPVVAIAPSRSRPPAAMTWTRWSCCCSGWSEG